MFLNAKLIHMLSQCFYLSFYLEYQGEYGKIQNSITDFSKHYSVTITTMPFSFWEFIPFKGRGLSLFLRLCLIGLKKKERKPSKFHLSQPVARTRLRSTPITEAEIKSVDSKKSLI